MHDAGWWGLSHRDGEQRHSTSKYGFCVAGDAVDHRLNTAQLTCQCIRFGRIEGALLEDIERRELRCASAGCDRSGPIRPLQPFDHPAAYEAAGAEHQYACTRQAATARVLRCSANRSASATTVRVGFA